MPLLYVDLVEGRAPAEIRSLPDAIHDALVVVRVVSRRRTSAMKQRFYELAAANLAARCGLDPADLLVSITQNDDADWSLGHERAQFLTGELR